MKVTKHQHYVPCMHLRHFGKGKDDRPYHEILVQSNCNLENKRDWMIWRYDKTNGSRKPLSIDDVLHENFFYSRVTDIHGDIEGIVAPILDKIELKEDIEGLTDEECLNFSQFITTLRIRTPFFKDVLANYERASLEEEHRISNLDNVITMFNHFFESNGLPPITKEEYEKRLESLPDNFRLPIEEVNKTGEKSVDEYINGEIKNEFFDFNVNKYKIHSYARQFRDKFAWILLKSDGVRRFITGDHPVISIGEKDICNIVKIDKTTEAHAFCISPLLCLIFIENGAKIVSKILVGENVVDGINQLIHFQASRFLIAMDEEDLPKDEDMDYKQMIECVFQIRGLYDNEIKECILAIKLFELLKKINTYPLSMIKFLKRTLKRCKLYRTWRNSIDAELNKLVTKD